MDHHIGIATVYWLGAKTERLHAPFTYYAINSLACPAELISYRHTAARLNTGSATSRL